LDLDFFNLLCNVLQTIVCPFVPFLLTIVLAGLFRFTNSGYPFVIFKLFFVPNSVLYPQNKTLLTHNQMPQY
jgi:hypothetical protein